MNLRRLAGFGPALLLVAVLVALWQLYVRVGQVNPHFLPAPSDIVQALVNNWDIISVNTIATLLETVIGMAAATIFGLLMAILLDISLWTRRAVYPLLVVSQTIPLIALAPLFLIWMGFGLEPKVIFVVLYCFFPIAVACADGLASAEPEMLNLLRSMRASRWQMLWLVRLPGAMPAFFSGLRIGITYSMTGAIVAEYIGAYQGLGIYMETSANSGAVDLVFAAILVTAIVSLLLFGLVSWLERIALPWYHGSTVQALAMSPAWRMR